MNLGIKDDHSSHGYSSFSRCTGAFSDHSYDEIIFPVPINRCKASTTDLDFVLATPLAPQGQQPEACYMVALVALKCAVQVVRGSSSTPCKIGCWEHGRMQHRSGGHQIYHGGPPDAVKE